MHPTRQLLRAASRRRLALPKLWNFWPAFLALIVLIGFWSWTSIKPSNSQDAAAFHPTPMMIITTVQAALPSSAPDPMPIPTPLSPQQTLIHQNNTHSPAQLTPFRLPIASPEVTNH
jgi:hypothetical protein